MKTGKSLRILIIVLAAMLTFAACGQPGGNITPTKPNSPSAPTTPSSPTQPPEEVPKDGLSADGTYYQLTDKNGVIVRIPIGKALNVDSDGNVKTPYTMSRGVSKLAFSRLGSVAKTAETKNQENNKTIYVFSKHSVINFGCGDIAHPVSGRVLGDPAGAAYTAGENQVLVMQFTDDSANAVAPGSKNAVYLYFWVLNYTGTAGSIANISFAAEGHLSADGVTTYSYFEFSQNTVSFGTPYTVKGVYKLQDEFGNLGETVYCISKQMTVIKPGEALTVTLEEYYCDSDWTPHSRTEYIYDSDYRNLEKYTKYDMQDRALDEIFYEDGMSYKFINHSYYENGQLRSYFYSDEKGSRSEQYNENGERTHLTIVTNTSPNSYTNYVKAVEADGFKMHFREEVVNGLTTYRMYLYDDGSPAELNRYDEKGRRLLEEYYDTAGNVTNRAEYSYNADGSYKVKYLDGSIYYYDKNDNFIKQE